MTFQISQVALPTALNGPCPPGAAVSATVSIANGYAVLLDLGPASGCGQGAVVFEVAPVLSSGSIGVPIGRASFARPATCPGASYSATPTASSSTTASNTGTATVRYGV